MKRRRFALTLVLLAACESTGPQPDLTPSAYITAKRAWAPGERDSVIARIMRDSSLRLPYMGNISDLAPQIFADPDSVVIIVPNPLNTSLTASAMHFHIMPPVDNTWSGAGLNIKIHNDAVTPRDTLSWVGGIWYKIGEETWHGWIVAADPDSVYPAVAVRTQNFDAGGGKSGAAGGEARLSTGEYWEADGSGNPHTVEITAATFGPYSTVTSGVFKGGDRRTGTMRGRVRNVTMPRELPTDNNTSINIDLDFRVTGVPAVSIYCLFPVPCIGETTGVNVSRLMARAQRARTAARR